MKINEVKVGDVILFDYQNLYEDKKSTRVLRVDSIDQNAYCSTAYLTGVVLEESKDKNVYKKFRSDRMSGLATAISSNFGRVITWEEACERCGVHFTRNDDLIRNIGAVFLKEVTAHEFKDIYETVSYHEDYNCFVCRLVDVDMKELLSECLDNLLEIILHRPLSQ